MRIYFPGGPRDHLVLVTPGADCEASDFHNPDGSLRQFKIRFEAGVAQVPSNLGDYLIDKGVARKTPALILSAPAAQDAVREERVRRHRILASA